MTLTREQRIEAYTYALFDFLEGPTNPWVSITEWERERGIGYRYKHEYPELTFTDHGSNQMKITALCRAIEQCEKSKV